MPKLTEYPEAQSFDENDILIKDGTNGTKKIQIEKVLEYMVDPTLTTPGKAADAKATKDAIDAVGEEVADVKTQITSLGENELSENTLADTANQFEYEIIANQYYDITVTLSNPTGSFVLRTKLNNATADFEERLYSGQAVSHLKVKATKNAHYLYFTSLYNGTLEIAAVSPDFVYTELGNTIAGNKAFVINTVLMDKELFTDTQYGGYISTNNGVGHIISTAVTPSNAMNSGIFAVKSGDAFSIIGRGGNAGRLWAFTDNDYRIKSVAGVNAVEETAITITAPSDGYLIVNFNVANPPIPSLIKKYGQDKVDIAYNTAVRKTGIDMFNTITCMGDSYTVGGMKKSDESDWSMAKKPYPAILAKSHGITVTNKGYSGSTVKTYLTTQNYTDVITGTANDLYILSWGINDAYYGLTLGSLADINDADYTQNGDTFYGNYGKIIASLQQTFPNCRIVVFGPWLFTGIYAKYNEAAKIIADHFGVGYCNPADDSFFTAPEWESRLIGGHPTEDMYAGMAYAIERLLSENMWDIHPYYAYAGLEPPPST